MLPRKEMSKLTVTNFSNRKGSPFQAKTADTDSIVTHEEVLQKSNYEEQKCKQSELIKKVTKKTAEYQAKKPCSGVFTEVVTHGSFSPKNVVKDNNTNKTGNASSVPKTSNANRSSSSLLGFPSSANDLALDAKTDLESDPSMSNEVKEKVIEKLFKLVTMVQHVYESKVRIATEYEKYKETHLRNDLRREKEHSEQLYKLNMNFQSEVVQSIQRLKSELDIARNVSRDMDENEISSKDSSVVFNSEEANEATVGNDEVGTIVDTNDTNIKCIDNLVEN